MLGTLPLKVEVESVHWEDRPDSGYSFIAADTNSLFDERTGRLHPGSASRLISPLTQRWLTENYEVSEGSSVPRNVLYEHYLDFCVRNSVQPVNAASFGKIIRQHFPNLKTRRLGSRGQSKYHYYGLAIKASSRYHMNDYSVVNTSRPYSLNKPTSISPVKPVPADVLASLLPEFPKLESLLVPEGVSHQHIQLYLLQYQTYSHNVLAVIVKATFSEVEPLLLRFWGSFSDEVLNSLAQFSDVLAYCDILLFKTIISLLLPTPLHPIPASLTQTIRSFCKQFGGWSRMAIAGLPENVVRSVLQASDIFVSMMRRQTTLTHIAQATRTVLSSTSAVSQMIHDWCHLDIDSMTHQALFLFSSPAGSILKRIQSEFSELLGEQASVEEYSEWIRELVDKFVVKKSEPATFKKNAQNFVTQWSYFISRIVRDLTLRSAPSFGSFHLLHMLFSDYVLHLIEEHQQTQLQSSLWKSIAADPGSRPDHGVLVGCHPPRDRTTPAVLLQQTDSRQTAMLSETDSRQTGMLTGQSAALQEQEISVTDDVVEVTSQPMMVTSSYSDDVMMVDQSRGSEQEDIDIESDHVPSTMLPYSNEHVLIQTSDRQHVLMQTAGRQHLQQPHNSPNLPNYFTTEDLLDGDTLSENLMEEILKCVSNSNCL